MQSSQQTGPKGRVSAVFIPVFHSRGVDEDRKGCCFLPEYTHSSRGLKKSKRRRRERRGHFGIPGCLFTAGNGLGDMSQRFLSECAVDTLTFHNNAPLRAGPGPAWHQAAGPTCRRSTFRGHGGLITPPREDVRLLFEFFFFSF